MGVKIEEFKTMKGGGKTRRETKYWRIVQERWVGTGRGGNWEPWRLEKGNTDSYVSTQHLRESDKEHSLWPVASQNFWSHPLSEISPILLVAISSYSYRPIPVAFYIINICIMQLSFRSFTQNCSYCPSRVVNIKRNVLDWEETYWLQTIKC